MNTSKIMLYKNVFTAKLKENNHKILVGLGILSGLAAIGYTMKKSMEVEPIIDAHNECLDDIKECREAGLDNNNQEYTEGHYKRDLVGIYLRTAGYFAKLYAPTVALEAISIASICAGVGVLDKKYVTAAATLASTYTEFSEYRNRVAQKYGEEVEFDIYNDMVEETVETEVVDENGKKKKVKEKIKVSKKTNPGTFSFFIGKDYCKYWDDNMTDEQNNAEMMIRLSGALSNSSRDAYNNGFVWFDRIAERAGITVTDAYRRAAIVYDLENYDENDQVSLFRNVKIRDSHLLEGGEKVLLVEFEGVIPEFRIDTFDVDKFYADKMAYKNRIAANN